MSEKALLLTCKANSTKTGGKLRTCRIMFAGVMCLAFTVVKLQGCSNSDSTTGSTIFDPTSPMVSYEAVGNCGPRGDHAQFDPSVCGENYYSEKHSDIEFTDNNGCRYLKYTIYVCDSQPPSLRRRRNKFVKGHLFILGIVTPFAIVVVSVIVGLCAQWCGCVSKRSARVFVHRLLAPGEEECGEEDESSTQDEKSKGTFLFYFPSSLVLYMDLEGDATCNDAAHEVGRNLIGWKTEDCLGGSIDYEEKDGQKTILVKTNSRSINSQNAFWLTKRGQQIGRPTDDQKAKEKFEEQVGKAWIDSHNTWGHPKTREDEETFRKLGNFLQAQRDGVVYKIEDEELCKEIEQIKQRYENDMEAALPEEHWATHRATQLYNLLTL